MRLDLRTILLAFVLVAIFCSSPLVEGTEVSGDRAYDHIEFLVNIAPRLAGSGAEATAASYIENEFENYGLEAWIENFAIKNFYRLEENRLRVITTEPIELVCVPVIYSPPAENLVGKLIHLTEVPEELEHLRDSVVLIERKKLSSRLLDLPPLAVILYCEGMEAVSEIWHQHPKMSAIYISSDDAKRLIELLGRGEVQVELSLRARIEHSTSHNVVAVLPGESEEIIIVGAHHDSVLTPGASDDASGVAVVLEIARVLASRRLPRTVLFVTFGSEEFGLWGSADFVNKHKGNDIVAMICFDVIAAGPENGLRVGVRDSPPLSTPELFDAFLWGVAENLGFHVCSEGISGIGGYSDYVSFIQAEIPATWIYWIGPDERGVLGPIHTLADNLSTIDKIRLRQVAEFGVEAVVQLTHADLEAWRCGYSEWLVKSSIFVLFCASLFVISIVGGCFAHYKRGWAWGRVVSLLLLATAVSLAVYLLFIV